MLNNSRKYLRTSSQPLRQQKYKLSLSSKKTLPDMKALPGLSNDRSLFYRNSPKHNMTLKTLNSQRSTCKVMKKTYTQDSSTLRQTHAVNKKQLAKSPGNSILVLLFVEQKIIQFKSSVSTVGALVQESRKIMIKNKIKASVVGFQSQDHILSLDFYLSLPQAKTDCLIGQKISIRPVFESGPQENRFKQFQIKRAIGCGGFSKVYLVRHKKDGKFYAMKVLDKAFILKQRKQKLVINQRDVMVQLSHPQLAKLHQCFQTRHHIIFIMDYYPGGQLFGVIRKFRRMGEGMARFYMIEILLGLQKLHDNGIAYRDFKPQNILLDRQGHAHISDFGLVKPGMKSQSSRAFSFCGSPEYMPPQIVARRGHSLSADFYSLGALLFELVTGLPPFYNRDPDKIYKATLKQQLTFPSNLSDNLTNLLEGLLCKHEQTRLGSRFGVRQILSHAWFGKFQKSLYLQKKLQAPVSFLQVSDYHFNQDEMKSQNQRLVAQLIQLQTDDTPFMSVFHDFDYNRKYPNQSMSNDRVCTANQQNHNFKRKVVLGNCSSVGRFKQIDNFV